MSNKKHIHWPKSIVYSIWCSLFCFLENTTKAVSSRGRQCVKCVNNLDHHCADNSHMVMFKSFKCEDFSSLQGTVR